MGPIMAAALGSGIVCGIWTAVVGHLSVSMPDLFSVWAGFAGITSFFAAGCGKKGLVRSTVSNLAGIAIGTTIIALSNNKPIITGAIITGFFTWLICYLSHIDLTKFAFCTFIGGFSSFAIGGNWKLLVLCMVLGNITGYICTLVGDQIFKIFGNKNIKEDWQVLNIFDEN